MQRLVQFRVLHQDIDDVVLVRRRLPSLSRTQVLRLPVSVREAHDAWTVAATATPALPVLRERARALALSLLELGETPTEVEHHLQRLRFHPSLCREALAWAATRAAGRLVPE
jgi:hypothetical protein